MIEYLSEIKTEFENTFACLSGAQMGLNHEKNGGRKSRDTLPVIYVKKCFMFMLMIVFFFPNYGYCVRLHNQLLYFA